LNLCRDH